MSNKAMDKDYLLRQLRSFEGDVLAQKSIASEEGYHNFRYYNGKFSYKNGSTWTDIDLSDTDYVELTQQEYDQLSTAEKMNGTLYFITDGQGQSVDNSIIADEFDSTESYSSGDYCIHEGKLYKFTASHAGAWSASDVDETTVSDEFGQSGSSTLVDLTDTNISNPSNGQVLKYNSTNSKWENAAESGGGSGIDGSTATPTDVIATWLECAGLHQSYTTLNEVLADSGVLYALINSTNAVDYMVRSTTWVATICADETAMGIVGNNDYCADTLLADSTWCTAICNSVYFEEVLNAKVPKMIGFTSPRGEAFGYESAGSNGSYPAFWRSFDENSSTYPSNINWTSANGEYYCGYKFEYDVIVKKVKIRAYKDTNSNVGIVNNIPVKLQGSNDGTTWTDIQTLCNSSELFNGVLTFNITNNSEYSQYRIYSSSNWCSLSGYNNHTIGCNILQFYGRKSVNTIEYSPLIPIMTSNTTPSGEVSASSVYNNNDQYAAWRAFDNNGSYGWASTSGTSSWIKYIFTEPKSVVRIKMKGHISSYTLTGKLQYSDDNTNWNDVGSSFTVIGGEIQYVDFPDCGNHMYWRVYQTSTGNDTFNTYILQFYNHVDDRIEEKADITAIAKNESNSTASKAYAVGEHFYKNGKFCTAKAAIASGALFTLGTNYVEGDIADCVISFSDKIETINQSLPSGGTSVTLLTYTATKTEVKSFCGQLRLAAGNVVPSDNDACFGGGLTLTRGGVIYTLTYTQMNLMPKVRYNNIPISAVVKLNAGDVIKVVVFQTSGSAITLDGNICY